MASLRQQVDDLREILDQIESVLEDAYQAEATREELAGAAGEALGIISPDESEEDTEDEAEEEA
jgi:hypothetical protein